MACTISINSIEGILDPISSEIVKIIVKGSASECAKVKVSISNVLTSSIMHSRDVEVIAENWLASWDLEEAVASGFDPNLHFTTGEYTCGSIIKTIIVECQDDPDCKEATALPLSCRTDAEPTPTCPQVQIEEEMGNCADSIRTVNFVATFISDEEGTYQWEYSEDDMDAMAFIPPADAVTGIRTITGTSTYDTSDISAATVKLHFLFPPSLSCVSEHSFDVDPCGTPPPKECDPNTSLTVKNKDTGADVTGTDCLPPGTYIVEVVEPDESGLTFLWFENGILVPGQSGTTMEVTIGAGEDKSVSVVIQKENCVWNPNIDLTDCTEPPPPPPCPEVAPIQVDISDDCENDIRTVDISVNLTGETDQSIGAEVKLVHPDDNVTVLSSENGTGALNFESSQELSAGDYSVRVDLTNPANCGSHSQAFTVDPCDPPPPPTTDLTIDLCLLLRIFAMLGFGFLVLGLVLLLCPTFSWFSPQVTMIIGGIMAAAGALFFIGFGLAWIIICKPEPCDYLLIAWQMFIVAGAVFTYAAFCPTCGYLGFGLVGIAIGFGLYIWWVFQCRPTVCRSLIEWFVLVLFVLDVVSVVEIILGSCVLTSSWWAALIWAGFLIAFKIFLVMRMRANNCSIGFG